MGLYKKSAKQDGVKGDGPRCSQKSMAPGCVSGNVSSQENPRRMRRQDYTPKPQPRESGIRY